METLTQTETSNREIAISRILNAPRELVWKVWTEPEHIAKWWGPNGFTNTIHEMNVKEGGVWRFMMHAPNGMNFPNKMVYDEIVKPERLVISHSQEDANDPNLFQTIVTFEEKYGKTHLTMRLIFATAEERNRVAEKFGAIEGQQQTFARLEEHLSGMLKGEELVITRVLNAPREHVYKAFSEAEALAEWWGPVGLEMCGSNLDFRAGGFYHYGMKSPDGNTMWGKFRYLEIVAPERIVFINSFSDKEGNITRAPFNASFPLEVMNILTLAEHGKKTTLTLRGGPINATEAEHKIFHDMYSGMQQGFGATFDQLANYLAKNTK